MKQLLAPLTLAALFLSSTPVLAARRFNFYLTADNSCAIYNDRIDAEKNFTLWLESQRQLIIKANSDLKVAVISQGRLVIPYQVGSVSETELSTHSYRTLVTGNYLITVQGKNQEATISFCLN